MSDLDNRTQPEFSLGERLARVESSLDPQSGLQQQIDRRFIENEKLRDEQIRGLRNEVGAISGAQKEAVLKAEIAVAKQIELMQEQADKRAEVSNQRIGALESSDSKGEGKEQGKQAFWAIMVSVVTILISLTVVLVTILSHH